MSNATPSSAIQKIIEQHLSYKEHPTTVMGCTKDRPCFYHEELAEILAYIRTLEKEAKNRCAECGATTIDGCLRCGAPVCCPQCCIIFRQNERIAALEKEHQAMRASITFCNTVANNVRGAGSALVGIGKIKCRTEDCLTSLTTK